MLAEAVYFDVIGCRDFTSGGLDYAALRWRCEMEDMTATEQLDVLVKVQMIEETRRRAAEGEKK